jgi:hypothetical protein
MPPQRIDRSVAVAGRYAIPAIYPWAEVCHHRRLRELRHCPYRNCQAGNNIGRTLEGAKPADLPIQQPTKFVGKVRKNLARLLVCLDLIG